MARAIELDSTLGSIAEVLEAAAAGTMTTLPLRQIWREAAVLLSTNKNAVSCGVQRRQNDGWIASGEKKR